MSVYNIANIDMSKVTIGERVRNIEDGSISHSINYNDRPFKFRVPVGVITGFYQLPDTFEHIHGPDQYTPNAKVGCKIVFKGCDPFVKDSCTVETPVSNVYNFVLSLQNQIVKNAVENSVKLFGRTRSEEVIRECLHGIEIGRKKADGGSVPDGKTPPWIRVTVKYSDIVGRGDAKMSRTDDVSSTPYVVTSPTVATKGFCMMPIITLARNTMFISWKVEYDNTTFEV